MLNQLWERKPFSTIGINFIVSAIIVAILVFIIFFANKETYETYDYQKINKDGAATKAVIVDIEKSDIVFNGEVVYILTYKYNANRKVITDRFKTSTSDGNTPLFKFGQEIEIKYLRNQSLIQNSKPFVFSPLYIIIILSIFLVLGIIFLLIALLPSLRDYKLYKLGTVKEAEIISLQVQANIRSNGPMVIYRSGLQRIIVHYFFSGKNGKNVIGQSMTTDYSIIEKSPQEIR